MNVHTNVPRHILKPHITFPIEKVIYYGVEDSGLVVTPEFSREILPHVELPKHDDWVIIGRGGIEVNYLHLLSGFGYLNRLFYFFPEASEPLTEVSFGPSVRDILSVRLLSMTLKHLRAFEPKNLSDEDKLLLMKNTFEELDTIVSDENFDLKRIVRDLIKVTNEYSANVLNEYF